MALSSKSPGITSDTEGNSNTGHLNALYFEKKMPHIAFTFMGVLLQHCRSKCE